MEKFSLEVSDVQVEELSNKDFLKLKLYAISDGVNRNNSEFLLEGFEDGIKTIPNKPILAYYNRQLVDTEEHNSRLSVDIDGNVFEDFQYAEAERPVGVTPESSNITIEEKDGKHWIVIDNALVWTNYNKQLTDLLLKQKSKKVSVEVEILDSFDDDGTEKFRRWNWLGITILGKYPDGVVVEEGIEGAHLELSEYANSERFRTFKKKMSEELEKSSNKMDILTLYGLKGKATMSLTLNEMTDKIRSILNAYTWVDGEYTYSKYYLHDIIFDDNIVIVEDYERGVLIAVPYTIVDDNITLDIKNAKDASITYKYTLRNEKVEVFLAKKEWGTGSSIKIDTSKEAVSSSSWGDVNKTELRNKVLKAKNYRSLVKSVYLKVEDGWEDAPASHLKYPVMQISGDKAVYNEGGLLSAQQYGEKHDKSVAKKAKRIRIKLGLTEKERSERMTKFIELARNEGFIYMGTADNKLYFIKDEELKDNKVCESMNLYFVSEDMAKDEEKDPEKDFAVDILGMKPVAFADDEKPEDEGDDEGDEDDKEKEALKVELESCKAELKAKCDELDAIRMKEMKEKTDALMAKEGCEEEMKSDLCKMRDEGKFASYEDFAKEFAYRKFISKSDKPTDEKSMTFSLNTSNGDNGKARSIFDELN